LFDTTAFNGLPEDGLVWSKRCRSLVLLKCYCESDDSCGHWLVTITESDSTKQGYQVGWKTRLVIV